jgi:hypothetical protein
MAGAPALLARYWRDRFDRVRLVDSAEYGRALPLRCRELVKAARFIPTAFGVGRGIKVGSRGGVGSRGVGEAKVVGDNLYVKSPYGNHHFSLLPAERPLMIAISGAKVGFSAATLHFRPKSRSCQGA